ncbi:MAG: serine/threonine-protein kinase [Verrucomicrobia bacterium]|nr:serine/threonine-protein kinase [Verrucomicrobiota bacterium]
MPTPAQCSECSADLTLGGQGGLCQRCLLKLGLGATAEGPTVPSPDRLENTDAPPNAEVAIERSGATIGRYKLLEQIGEGGFGVVYMAEQTEPVQRKVALKIIKAGMDTREVIARFEAERQALALMDHSNIAKVFDGGTTSGGARLSSAAALSEVEPREHSYEPPPAGETAAAGDSRAPIHAGRPYFVMELVRGIPITRFCDQRNLPTDERLRLFVKVCAAVQHAHQKGVIHRDLKPSNILVTLHDGEPVPKVIDFGVAKALGQKLTDKTLFTGFLRMVGTPAYMSPEQAELSGLDIDTRADIYALGVLLYELLTGVMPFDAETFRKAALDEIRRMIRETEPPKPSTRLQTLGDKLTEVARHRGTESPRLIHIIRGDLDWIVMKCLEKDRTRRYETVNGLAMDVQRHLDNEPIVARPPTAGYRLQKLIRRNKLAFLAGGAIAVSLLVGLTISTVSLYREKAARERAVAAEQAQIKLREQAQTEAARSAEVAQFLKDMLRGVGPATALGRDTTMLREILDQIAARLDALLGQPAVEADLCATLGNVYFDLGEYTNSVTKHSRAFELRRELRGMKHAETAQSLNDLAHAIYYQGKHSEAEALHREALAIRRDLFGDEHLDVAESLTYLGETLRKQGKWGAAEPLHREALAMRTRLLGREHLEVAHSLNYLGVLLWRQGKHSQSEAMHREALNIRRRILGTEHPDIAGSLHELGLVLNDARRHEEAETVHREALAMRRRLLGREHPDVGHSLQNLGYVFINQGRMPEAEPLVEEAVTLRTKRLGVAHWETTGSLVCLADVLYRQAKYRDAEAVYRQAAEAFEQVVATYPRQAYSRRDLNSALSGVYDSLWQQNKVEESLVVVRQAIGVLDQALADFPEQRQSFLPPQAQNYRRLGEALHKNGQEDEADRQFGRVKEIALEQKRGDRAPAAADTLHGLANVFHDHGKLAEAEALYREVLAIHRKHYGNEHERVTSSLVGLAFVLTKMPDRNDEAEATCREALTILRKLPGDNYSDLTFALDILSGVLDAKGRRAEAVSVHRELLEMARTRLSADDPQLASRLAQSATALLAVEQFTEAEPLARECLAIREKRLPDDWLTFNARSLLGGALLGQKKFAEAEPLLLSGYEGMKHPEEKIPPAGKTRPREALERIVQLYTDCDKPAQAAEWKQKLANLDQPSKP